MVKHNFFSSLHYRFRVCCKYVSVCKDPRSTSSTRSTVQASHTHARERVL
jgi:hypothetical protein